MRDHIIASYVTSLLVSLEENIIVEAVVVWSVEIALLIRAMFLVIRTKRLEYARIAIW